MSFDIMLPFWGEPKYLFEAVESVLAQDSEDWHLTVIDDRYGDPQVPQYLAALDDPRITYLENDENLGVAGNFRRSIELATSDYLMVMGCDDVLLPNYVSTMQRAIATNPQVDIIQPGVETIDSAGKIRWNLADRIKYKLRPNTAGGPQILTGDNAASRLLVGDWLYWPSLTFRRETIAATPFREGYEVVLDLGVVIDILMGGGKLLLLPEVTFRYRRHDESVSSVKLLDGSRFAEERSYFAQARQAAQARGWKKSARAANTYLTSRAHALALLPQAIKHRNKNGAKTLVRHAFGRL
ncbi:glycosyl transferase domain-containing protein [Actinobaculum suis]|uniref:Glycosyl transferase domain-containing protein n=1 Tax=Actinobaculum suis TaxID=1657 RepID=A0A7Z9C838_9ACTO|nr:glycosyltransferase [Actinobaculum suis]VDG75920.1 glycosyl transferase domain-containing protein [Actinobaculum suis]